MKSRTGFHPCLGGNWAPHFLNSLDHLVGVGVGDLDGARHVPGDVDHGDDRLDPLHLVPLKPLQGQLVLVSCRETQPLLGKLPCTTHLETNIYVFLSF